MLLARCARRERCDPSVENVDVMWVPRNLVSRFIDADTIGLPILAALEEQT
jgi:8-oxo-dGTP diphosphatase